MSHLSLLASLLVCSLLVACIETNTDTHTQHKPQDGNSDTHLENDNETDSETDGEQNDTGSNQDTEKTLPDLSINTQQDYTEQWLVNIDSAKLSQQAHTNIVSGETMQQSFMLRSLHPIDQTVNLSHLFFKQYFWTGKDSDVQFSIIEPDTQAVLIQQDFLMESIDPKAGLIQPDGARALKLKTALNLELNKPYVMQFQVNRAESPLSLYQAAQDYTHGENSQGPDIWFKAVAQAKWLQYDAINIESDAQNKLVFDPGWATPLKAKMLNLGSNSEILWVNKQHNNLVLRYELSNPIQVNLQVVKEAKTSQDKLILQGLAAGSSYLNIYHNQQLIEQVELQVNTAHTLKLSFSYIAYPGETEHDKMQSFERVKADFNKIYQPLNIQLDWHNNGVIVFDWDLNGDGNSYTAEYDELHSPMTHNILPNMQDYFSNVYLFRIDKNDDTYRGCNGGGSSYTSAGNSAPRLAFKSVHVPQDLGCIAPTLMHELAHNLGLSHYSAANSAYLPVANEKLNLMKTGRDEQNIFAFQWKVIHQTLSDLTAQGKF